MANIKFYNRKSVPKEMHKVKIVQKLTLLPARERLAKMKEAGFNTFLLHNGDIFMDMLTDSGVNAMSDNMQSAMLRADDGLKYFGAYSDALDVSGEGVGGLDESIVFLVLGSVQQRAVGRTERFGEIFKQFHGVLLRNAEISYRSKKQPFLFQKCIQCLILKIVEPIDLSHSRSRFR